MTWVDSLDMHSYQASLGNQPAASELSLVFEPELASTRSLPSTVSLGTKCRTEGQDEVKTEGRSEGGEII
jgi:hypothetical protein